MRRDNLPWRPVQPATVNWSEAGAPVSAGFGDVYYSQDNGLAESRHVFLHGNNLPHRWQTHTGRHFCIGELGFGTGLNFLLTWQAWQALPAPRPDLHYVSIEKHPLTRSDLARALSLWPELANLAGALLPVYPGLLAGQHRILLQDGVRLDLWWEDATDALLDIAGRNQPLVDAWYLDGFAPARNETMWSAQVINTLAKLSHADATFATFTAAGHVRRKLMDAGFTVSKVAGYGRKRECLRGVLKPKNATKADTTLSPWDLVEWPQDRPQSALIVGGGLAGCTTAAALARRGIAVTLLERGALSNGGSGNDQGVLYTRLSRKHSALVDFALQGFLFASIFYRSMFQSGALKAQTDGELCGSFQQSRNTNDMTTLGQALIGLEELAQVLDAAQANEMLGINQPSAGYWYPGSGWLRPAAVCKALTTHNNIRVVKHCGDVTLKHAGGTWLASAGTELLAQATVAIVGAGTGTDAFAQCSWLPVQSIRGQITELPAAQGFSSLRAVLCHEGYIAPAREGTHSIGATFNPTVSDSALRSCDNRDNLEKLAEAVPACRAVLDTLDPAALQGRVGYRCTSPDYLPIVGPAPQREEFLQNFSGLRRNARQAIDSRGSYWPGLYLNTAHGSRGLTSTPIAAELLASMICDEPLPLSRALCRALSPARFIIRDLSRNRVQA
jgi:tRNA 5-methylaminomethyl-2-thiouridine biosynthesis bifunctional protein